MPELPEVETTVRALREPLIGRTIIDVWNDWPRLIVQPDFDELKYRIHNQTVQAISRRAKYLVFHLTHDEYLIIHLKMSGHLSVVSSDIPRHKHVHTVFILDNGKELRFKDMRKFGRVYLVKDIDALFSKLGPEPLEESFTVDLLKERIKGRRTIKSVLLDQHVVVGIGNIYADEALFYAGIHPERRADQLAQKDYEKLHAAIQKVLKLGIAREGASIDLYAKPDGSRGDMQNAVAVFRRTGQLCHQCEKSTIERIKLNGRSTHFCPTCQR